MNNTLAPDRWLDTPIIGIRVKEKNLEKNGRVECPYCHLAVIEDEFLHCEGCDTSMCLYCYEVAPCPEHSINRALLA